VQKSDEGTGMLEGSASEVAGGPIKERGMRLTVCWYRAWRIT